MFKVQGSIQIKTSAEKVFSVYQDVKNWNKWDIGLDFSSIEGELKSGAIGKLKPKKSPVVADVEFVKVEQNSFFHVHNISILCIFDFYHQIEKKDNFVEVTHTIKIKSRFKILSPISSFIGKKIGQNIQKDLSTVLENFKKIAES